MFKIIICCKTNLLKFCCLIFIGSILSGCLHATRINNTNSINSVNYYTVGTGDSLTSIARKLRMPKNELARLNNIKNQNHIQLGKKLKYQKNTNADRYSVAGSKINSPKSTVAKVTPRSKQTISAKQKAAPSGNKDIFVSKIQWRKPTQGAVVRTYNPSLPGRNGVQYSGVVGQAVAAAATGKVVHVGATPGGQGRLIILKHSTSIYSTYGYLSDVLVQEGASVNIGQPIAKMGRNYNTTGLLNFEIRVNNKTSNPLFYLK